MAHPPFLLLSVGPTAETLEAEIWPSLPNKAYRVQEYPYGRDERPPLEVERKSLSCLDFGQAEPRFQDLLRELNLAD